MINRPWGPQQAPIGKQCAKCSNLACAEVSGTSGANRPGSIFYLCQEHLSESNAAIRYTWELVGPNTYIVHWPPSVSVNLQPYEWMVEILPPNEIWSLLENGAPVFNEVVSYGQKFAGMMVMTGSDTYDDVGNRIATSEATIRGEFDPPPPPIPFIPAAPRGIEQPALSPNAEAHEADRRRREYIRAKRQYDALPAWRKIFTSPPPPDETQ